MNHTHTRRARRERQKSGEKEDRQMIDHFRHHAKPSERKNQPNHHADPTLPNYLQTRHKQALSPRYRQPLSLHPVTLHAHPAHTVQRPTPPHAAPPSLTVTKTGGQSTQSACYPRPSERSPYPLTLCPCERVREREDKSSNKDSREICTHHALTVPPVTRRAHPLTRSKPPHRHAHVKSRNAPCTPPEALQGGGMHTPVPRNTRARAHAHAHARDPAKVKGQLKAHPQKSDGNHLHSPLAGCRLEARQTREQNGAHSRKWDTREVRPLKRLGLAEGGEAEHPLRPTDTMHTPAQHKRGHTSNTQAAPSANRLRPGSTPGAGTGAGVRQALHQAPHARTATSNN